ncbi:MAG: hypothetical protein AMJ61_09165 [Desulfobacterales bacterium SG8_35_2]|nr:MAG: hypothetical protein AMJ61_09165 [Desulfobacterales bacterium SG8_35_2]
MYQGPTCLATGTESRKSNQGWLGFLLGMERRGIRDIKLNLHRMENCNQKGKHYSSWYFFVAIGWH